MLPSEYLKQGFCQGIIATDASGKPAPTFGSPAELYNFPRVNFSILGAINHACSDEMYFDGTYNKLVQTTACMAYVQLLREKIEFNIPDPHTTNREKHHMRVIWKYNDVPGRTQHEAVELMQRVESIVGVTSKMVR